MPRTPPEKEIPINITSLVSHRTKKGLVELQVGETTVQLPIDQARVIAQWLMEACEAAETDEFILVFFQGLGFEEGEAVQMIRKFRAIRDKRLARQPLTTKLSA